MKYPRPRNSPPRSFFFTSGAFPNASLAVTLVIVVTLLGGLCAGTGCTKKSPLTIVHYDDQILRKVGAKIEVFDAALATLARDMIETMHAAQGSGLAAQQIGRALQLCVVDLSHVNKVFDWELDGAHPPLEQLMPMTLVNPEVSAHAVKKETGDEGCLSFPGIRGDIGRPDKITVKFQDEKGVPHTLVCNGMLARCIQHEVDHLNGVLFIDRMSEKVRAPLEKKIKELAAKTRKAAGK